MMKFRSDYQKKKLNFLLYKTEDKKRTHAYFVYLFLVPVRGAFSTLFLASFHLNQPLHEAKKNKRYICISRGTYVFVFSPINEIFLLEQNKKMMKNKTPIFVQFLYLQKLPSALDGGIGVYNYVFFV